MPYIRHKQKGNVQKRMKKYKAKGYSTAKMPQVVSVDGMGDTEGARGRLNYPSAKGAPIKDSVRTPLPSISGSMKRPKKVKDNRQRMRNGRAS